MSGELKCLPTALIPFFHSHLLTLSQLLATNGCGWMLFRHLYWYTNSMSWQKLCYPLSESARGTACPLQQYTCYLSQILERYTHSMLKLVCTSVLRNISTCWLLRTGHVWFTEGQWKYSLLGSELVFTINKCVTHSLLAACTIWPLVPASSKLNLNGVFK